MIDILYKMPIPQTKIALGIVLAVIITLAYSYCLIAGKEVDEGGLAVMCGLVAAIFGIGAHEYKTKRTTDTEYVSEVMNAKSGRRK